MRFHNLSKESKNVFVIMNVEGIEPSTPELKVHRSATELYIRYPFPDYS